MRLLDVNILVYAHREDALAHPGIRRWLGECLSSPEAFGVPNLVFSGFLRVVTHPSVFQPPSPLAAAVAFTREVRSSLSFVEIRPGDRHWDIFLDLCAKANARGNLVPDAFLAALAIESGSEWITTDRGYGRFPGLRWRHPLE